LIRLLIVITALLAWTGAAHAGNINLDSPLESGRATVFEDSTSTTKELSASQLQELSAWLSWNRQGWFGEQAEAPAGPVELELELARGDGTTAVLSVVYDAGTQKHHLHFADKGIPATYSGWFGILKRPAASRPLADYELDILHKILSITRGDRGS
jgi:hypothetical protein